MVIVLTDKPLWKAMSNPKVARRMALWVIELSKFDIQYRPRTTTKGQVIADFIAEFTLVKGQGAEKSPQWHIHTDGSSNRQAGRAGVILHSPKGDKVECMVQLDFLTTHNEAKYETLIARLDFAKAVEAANVVIIYGLCSVIAQV